MPRKNRNVRLAQAKQTLEAFKAAGYMSHESKLSFMKDMIQRLERGKHLTKRQREWLDIIIEEGVPAPKGDVEYIAKIDEALHTKEISQYDREILISFRGKTVRGWDLSPKQREWCDKIIKKADDLRTGNYWKPDAETYERIKLAVSCETCYSDTYWYTHQAGAAAVRKAKDWLNGSILSIDEWTVAKLFKSVAGRLKDIEAPRHKEGDLVYVSRCPGIIVSKPTPFPVGVCYDVLIGGKVDRIHVNRILKRLKKEA